MSLFISQYTDRPARRAVLFGLLVLPLGLLGCGPPSADHAMTFSVGSRTVKIFVDGLARGARTVSTAPGRATVNGVAFVWTNDQLLINGQPYQGPPFTELHVTIMVSGAVETVVARP